MVKRRGQLLKMIKEKLIKNFWAGEDEAKALQKYAKCLRGCLKCQFSRLGKGARGGYSLLKGELLKHPLSTAGS
jgi:hypothetical protein